MKNIYLILLLSSFQLNNLTAQVSKNNLIDYWNFDNGQTQFVGTENGNVLSASSSVEKRTGINDGLCSSESVYLKNNNLTGTLNIDYTKDFAIAGWFSLEKAETYNSPTNQTLIGKFDGSNMEWKIEFIIVETDRYPNRGPNGDAQEVYSGQLCFTVSQNLGSPISVCNDFEVYTDSPFFVCAQFKNDILLDLPFSSLPALILLNNRKIELTVGNKANNLKTNTSQVISQISDKTNKLNIGTPLRGSVDNIGIWNRRLTTDEIKELVSGNNPYSNVTSNTKTIAFLGNSITYGYKNGTSALPFDKVDFSYPRRVQTHLPKNYYSANYGSRGLESPQILEKTNKSLLNMNYDWVSIAIGINDLRNCFDVDDLINNITLTANALLNANSETKVILNTIPPYLNIETSYNTVCVLDSLKYRTKFDSANNQILNLFKNNPRVFHSDISKTLSSVSNPYKLKPIYDSGDAVHPNQLGLDAIARNIADIILVEDLPINDCDTSDIKPCDDYLISDNNNIISKIKKYSSTGWENAGGSSNYLFKEGDYFTYQVTSNKSVMVGLSSQDIDANFSSINYAFYSRFDNLLYSYRDGASTPLNVSYDQNTILKVSYESDKICFYANGVLLICHNIGTAIAENFVLDFAMFEENSELNNLKIYNCNSGICEPEEFNITNDIGITQINTTITKYSENSNWGAGGGSATIRVNTGDYITYAVNNNKSVMVGLSTINENAHFNTIENAFYSRFNDSLYIYKNGALYQNLNESYDESSVLKISYNSNEICYYKDNVTLFCDIINSTGPLVLDFAMFENGASIKDLNIFTCANELRNNTDNTSDKYSLTNVTRLNSEEKTINIYPNPTNDYFKINMSGDLSILDSQGHLVKRFISYQSGTSINDSVMSPGVYIIHIKTQSASFYTKLIVK